MRRKRQEEEQAGARKGKPISKRRGGGSSEDEDEDVGGDEGNGSSSRKAHQTPEKRKSLAAALVAGLAQSLGAAEQEDQEEDSPGLLARAREHGDKAREKAGRSRSVGKSAISVFKGIANLVGLRKSKTQRGPMGKQPWMEELKERWDSVSAWEHISGNVPPDCLVPEPAPPVRPEGHIRLEGDDEDEDEEMGPGAGGKGGWGDNDSTATGGSTASARRQRIGLPAVGVSIPMRLDVVPMPGLDERREPIHFP